jgi:hypothetical protein
MIKSLTLAIRQMMFENNIRNYKLKFTIGKYVTTCWKLLHINIPRISSEEVLELREGSNKLSIHFK